MRVRRWRWYKGNSAVGELVRTLLQYSDKKLPETQTGMVIVGVEGEG